MGNKRWAALLVAAMMMVLTACGSRASSSLQSLPQPSSEEAPVSVSQPVTAQDYDLDDLVVDERISSLTGLARADDVPSGQRPVAVMINNSFRARPQRGLAAADVLVEMLAKKNTSYIMALYDNFRGLNTTGPVSGTFDQFVQFALPLNAIQVHTDASQYARNLLTMTGTPHVDGVRLGNISFGFDFARTTPRPGGKLNEYCWFTDSNLMIAGMDSLGVPHSGELTPLFNFGRNATPSNGEAIFVDVAYSDESQTTFAYDVNSGLYYKYIDGAFHTDEDGGQLTFTNVVVLYTNVTNKADSDQYLEFDFSTGGGFYFTAGGVQTLTWVKGGPQEPLRLLDENHQELVVNPGKSYVGIVYHSYPGAISWRTA